jgi:hypothetical protein
VIGSLRALASRHDVSMLTKPSSGFKFTSDIPTKSISHRQDDVCTRQVHLPVIHDIHNNIPSGNDGYSIFPPISSLFGNCCPDHSPNSKFPTSLYSRHVKSPDYSFKEHSYSTFPQLKYPEKVFDLRVTPWRSESFKRQMSCHDKLCLWLWSVLRVELATF